MYTPCDRMLTVKINFDENAHTAYTKSTYIKSVSRWNYSKAKLNSELMCTKQKNIRKWRLHKL